MTDGNSPKVHYARFLSGDSIGSKIGDSIGSKMRELNERGYPFNDVVSVIFIKDKPVAWHSPGPYMDPVYLGCMDTLQQDGHAVYSAVKEAGLVLYREPEHLTAIKKLFENDVPAPEFVEVF